MSQERFHRALMSDKPHLVRFAASRPQWWCFARGRIGWGKTPADAVSDWQERCNPRYS